MHDILAHAHSYATPTAAVRYAAGAARLLGASLTGVYVTEPIVPVSAIGPAAVIPEIYSDEVQREAAAAAAHAPGFAQWASDSGIGNARWEVRSGFYAQALAAAGIWCDALVLESNASAAWGTPSLLGEILISGGIPCFVVPQDHDQPATFDTVVVASHGSTEAVRAVHAALPLLQKAKHVVLLHGQPADASSGIDWKPPFSVTQHLLAHGVRFVERALQTREAAHAGAQIIESARDARADLLVMGAYGRTRFSEWVLGGATRHMLERARIPLFMRH